MMENDVDNKMCTVYAHYLCMWLRVCVVINVCVRACVRYVCAYVGKSG